LSSVSILGCGESGQYWDGIGDSIGVNDCWKFGHPTDYLMVLDPPGRFTEDRRKIIRESKPLHFITDQNLVEEKESIWLTWVLIMVSQKEKVSKE
jgi:hypothetical protein